MFASSHPHRFKLLGCSKKNCSRLKVDDTVITDLPCLLNACADHFSNLARSEAFDNPDLVELKASMEALTPVSMENEEYILDIPFTVEEVEKAIKRLKRRKALGQIVVICVTNILNAIIDLETILQIDSHGGH